MRKNPSLIEFDQISLSEDQVNIDVFNLVDLCPFVPKRIYTIKTAENESQRGFHAHKNQSQVISIIKGQAKVLLLNNEGEKFVFNLTAQALFIPQNHWIEITLHKDSILLCFAEKLYHELSTIKDKTRFLNK
ncbi:MAG: WxcM-like domain-containing protein [Chitinophagales bacterium]